MDKTNPYVGFDPGPLFRSMKRETFDMTTLKKKISDMDHSEFSEDCSEGCEHVAGTFPTYIRRRVHALKYLQGEAFSISSQFRQELLELERRYALKYIPIYSERAKIVQGLREPLGKELENFSTDAADSETEEKDNGIPNFWLHVLQNHPSISSLITENDTEALQHLQDIRVMYLSDNPGFKIEFEFSPNEFFSNDIIVKEYHLACPDAEDHTTDFVYDHAVGSKILWKEGKNLCFKTITRTQRHRSNNNTRTVRREEPQESFFHFFLPPTMTIDENDGEENVDELESRLQMDYELGELLKDSIVPNAVDWYTGEALEYAELEDGDFEDEEDYDDDSESGSEEEDSDEEQAPGTQSHPQEKPECKQQ